MEQQFADANAARAMMEKIIKNGVSGSALGEENIHQAAAATPGDVEDAVIVEETKREPETAEINKELPETPAKKPGPFTIQISPRNPFTPPHAIFMGTGGRVESYKRWLGNHFKQSLADLGREKKQNGNYTRAYADAVRFIRTIINIVKYQDMFEEVILQTPKWPRELNQSEAILDVIKTNIDLIKAIAPYYDPSFQLPATQTPQPEPIPEKPAEEVAASRADIENSLMDAFNQVKAEEAKAAEAGAVLIAPAAEVVEEVKNINSDVNDNVIFDDVQKPVVQLPENPTLREVLNADLPKNIYEKEK